MKLNNFNIKKKNTLWALGLSMVLINGCTNLDEEIFSTISTEQTELTPADVENLVGSVHASLRSMYWGWDGLFDIYEESSDLIMTPLRIGVGWGDYYVAMHKHQFNPNISHFYGLWYNAYRGISGANAIIDLGEESNEFVVAEMRALRALFYYYLLDNFRNVPLVTTQDLPSGFLPTQADPQEVFDFVVSELQTVKNAFGDEKGAFGRMNRYAVSMILAKMHLNYNAWFQTNDLTHYESALREVDDVLNAGYTLADNYEDPFKQNINTCPEVIFAIPFDITYAGGNYLSNKALHAASSSTFGLTAAPWNGNGAIPQFVDTYDEDDERFAKTWLIGQQYTSEGAPITLGGEPFVYTREVTSIDGATPLQGARFRKYEIVGGNVGTASDDVPLFRLSDAYFIKAECLLRLGRDEQEAANLVTAVRRRAFKNNPDKAIRTVQQLKGGSVYRYGHYENGAFQTEEGGQDVEFGGLLDDLAWEFVGEHHRRQDLIRFKLDNQTPVYIGKSWFCKDAEGSGAMSKLIFPIHSTFLNANILLKQNAGYE